MDRDRRLTGYLRGQTDSPSAPAGFELNNPWRVSSTSFSFGDCLLIAYSTAREAHPLDVLGDHAVVHMSERISRIRASKALPPCELCFRYNKRISFMDGVTFVNASLVWPTTTCIMRTRAMTINHLQTHCTLPLSVSRSIIREPPRIFLWYRCPLAGELQHHEIRVKGTFRESKRSFTSRHFPVSSYSNLEYNTYLGTIRNFQCTVLRSTIWNFHCTA